MGILSGQKLGLQYFEGLSLHIVVVTRRRKGETRLVNPGWCHDDCVSEGPRRSAASGKESGEEEGQTRNRAEYLEREWRSEHSSGNLVEFVLIWEPRNLLLCNRLSPSLKAMAALYRPGIRWLLCHVSSCPGSLHGIQLVTGFTWRGQRLRPHDWGLSRRGWAIPLSVKSQGLCTRLLRQGARIS